MPSVKKWRTGSWRRTVSFKDLVVLSLLSFVDMTALIHDYARLPGRVKFQQIPFEEVKRYLDQINKKGQTGRPVFNSLKRKKALSLKQDKLFLNLNDKWWQDMFEIKFRFFSAPHSWDGWWLIVFFDIPEEKRKVRDFFRRTIKDLGFVLWQKSVWVTINKMERPLKELIEGSNIDPWISVLRAKSVFGDKDREIIKNLFDTKDLEASYQRFLLLAKESLKKKDYSRMKELFLALPELILKDTGVPDEFFEDVLIRKKMWQTFAELRGFVAGQVVF
ncbi:hypothetical protein KKD61_00625 [Patescibacteria group bacterium]|nr:hypothetical protein [Patescibacteria group bacterium]